MQLSDYNHAMKVRDKDTYRALTSCAPYDMQNKWWMKLVKKLRFYFIRLQHSKGSWWAVMLSFHFSFLRKAPLHRLLVLHLTYTV